MTEFEQRMAAFRARFLERAAADASKMEAALAREDWRQVHAICHSLSGNAGMFGFIDTGVEAQAVEEAIDAGTPTNQVQVMTEALLRRLQGLA